MKTALMRCQSSCMYLYINLYKESKGIWPSPMTVTPTQQQKQHHNDFSKITTNIYIGWLHLFLKYVQYEIKFKLSQKNEGTD